MAYYLGYRNNTDYIKIDLTSICATDLLEIVKYTCNFTNDTALKEELYDASLIPNTNVELAYLIEKGKKGNKTYVKVPNINQIYFSSSKLSFNIDCIRNYLIQNINNKELFLILYASYLKKIGILDDIKEYLKKLLTQPGTLNIVFKELLDILKDSSVSLNLKYILTSGDQDINSKQIDLLIKTLSKDNQLLCSTFNYLKRRLNAPFSKILEDLRLITNLQNRDYTDEYAISSAINNYINSLTHTVSKDNGTKEKQNTRDIVDVGVIIQDYKEYQLELASQRYQESNYQPNQEDEDFLEEADFERENTTSDACGIYLRVTDSMKWTSGANNGH